MSSFENLLVRELLDVEAKQAKLGKFNRYPRLTIQLFLAYE